MVGISLLAFSPHTLAGAGTYMVGLTRALVARAPERYVAFLPRRHEALWRQFLPAGVEVVVCGPDPDHRTLRVGFEQLRLPRIARRHHVETIFFPHLLAPAWRWPRAVVTIYDLLLLSRRTNFGWHKRLYHRWAYRNVGRRAAHIVTISAFCRREIVERLGVPADHVSVAPPGLDPEFLAEASGGSEGMDLPPRYLLAVAGSYPHKRLDVVLDVFARLSREQADLHLVLAGTQPGERGLVPALLAGADRALGARVHVLPRLARQALPELFRRAAALVSASEFEGFGIPILEAMAVGCPVAIAPAAGAVEVLGGCGWVATDCSAPALTTAVRTALAARRFAPAIVAQASDRARSTFSWAASAEQVEALLSVE